MKLSWGGSRYPSISWALPDIYARYPLATDGQVARRLKVRSVSVCLARRRAGIPTYDVRSPRNPYQRRQS